MSYKIDEIEGIGPAMSEKLAAAEIKTTDDLLDLCCSAKGRKEGEGLAFYRGLVEATSQV